jgi:formate hydrogenlyase transcriptional activator
LETQQLSGDGRTHDVEVFSNFLKFGDYEFLCSFGRDITERKRAEQALRKQIQFERLISDIGTRLTKTGLEDIQNSIDSTLQALGEGLQVERSFFGQLSEDRNGLIVSNTWAAEGVRPDSDIFNMDFGVEIPWVLQQMHDGKVINAGPGLEGLPDGAQGLRSQLELDGITSGVVVPLRIGGRLMGMLGLDTVNQPREYPQSLVDRLLIVADMLGSTLRRIHVENKLRESENKFRAFMDNSPALTYMKNESGKHIYANKTLCDLFEITPDQFIGTDTGDFFPEKVAKRIEGYDDEVRKKGIPVETDDYSVEVRKQVRWWKEIKFPIKSASRENMVGGVVLDITTRKRDELKLKKAYEEIKKLRDKLEQENIFLHEEMEICHQHGEIVGESPAIKGVLSQSEKVAGQTTCVLILGETGTGKELLARAIHRMSPRNRRQMITVNCAALPSNLIESELFGREKGAFTGALTKQIGRFEAADGSSIFLDEIGDLSLELQAKLLRVLQDGQFERLGNPETIHADVRVLAATNHDLKALAQEGRFRKDLYYRLNVFPIEIPPLRDRLEDIPLLVWTFVKEFEESMGKSIKRIPQKTMDFLKSSSWPGNVRELRNVIERAMILSTDAYLDIPALEPAVEATIEDLSLEGVQRKHIMGVLQRTGWRIRGKQGAAAILEIKPTTLEARIKKLGIKRI